VGGQVETAKFTVKGDPRVSATAADLRARFDQTRRINAATTDVVEAINGLAALRAAADSRRAGLTGQPALETTLRRFSDSLRAWSGKLAIPRSVGDTDPYRTSSLSELQQFSFGDMNSPPTQAERTGSAETSVVDVSHRANNAVNAKGRRRRQKDDSSNSMGISITRITRALDKSRSSSRGSPHPIRGNPNPAEFNPINPAKRR